MECFQFRFFAGQVSKSQNLKAVWQKQTLETSVELASESQTQKIRRKRDLQDRQALQHFTAKQAEIKDEGCAGPEKTIFATLECLKKEYISVL